MVNQVCISVIADAGLSTVKRGKDDSGSQGLGSIRDIQHGGISVSLVRPNTHFNHSF